MSLFIALTSSWRFRGHYRRRWLVKIASDGSCAPSSPRLEGSPLYRLDRRMYINDPSPLRIEDATKLGKEYSKQRRKRIIH